MIDPVSKSRPFPWRCVDCGERNVYRETVSYTSEIRHDNVIHTVVVPELSVAKCRSCGEMYFDIAADEQISDAFRTQIGLLSPLEIQNLRESVGLDRGALADMIGVSPALVERWETGCVIQSRPHDNLLRGSLVKGSNTT